MSQRNCNLTIPPIFTTLIIPVLVGILIYEVQKIDETNKKTMLQFEKVIKNLNSTKNELMVIKKIIKKPIETIDKKNQQSILNSLTNISKNREQFEIDFMYLQILTNNNIADINSIYKVSKYSEETNNESTNTFDKYIEEFGNIFNDTSSLLNPSQDKDNSNEFPVCKAPTPMELIISDPRLEEKIKELLVNNTHFENDIEKLNKEVDKLKKTFFLQYHQNVNENVFIKTVKKLISSPKEIF